MGGFYPTNLLHCAMRAQLVCPFSPSGTSYSKPSHVISILAPLALAAPSCHSSCGVQNNTSENLAESWGTVGDGGEEVCRWTPLPT